MSKSHSHLPFCDSAGPKYEKLCGKSAYVHAVSMLIKVFQFMVVYKQSPATGETFLAHVNDFEAQSFRTTSALGASLRRFSVSPLVGRNVGAIFTAAVVTVTTAAITCVPSICVSGQQSL